MREDESAADFNSLRAASRASAKWKRPTARVGESQTAAGSHGVGRLVQLPQRSSLNPSAVRQRRTWLGVEESLGYPAGSQEGLGTTSALQIWHKRQGKVKSCTKTPMGGAAVPSLDFGNIVCYVIVCRKPKETCQIRYGET